MSGLNGMRQDNLPSTDESALQRLSLRCALEMADAMLDTLSKHRRLRPDQPVADEHVAIVALGTLAGLIIAQQVPEAKRHVTSLGMVDQLAMVLLGSRVTQAPPEPAPEDAGAGYAGSDEGQQPKTA